MLILPPRRALLGRRMVRRAAGTRQNLPDHTQVSNGTVTTANSRHYAYAVQPIVNPSVVYVGYGLTSTSEVDNANAITYHTAIELPDGTFHQFTKAGSVDHVVNPADTFNESDRLTGFTIPIGGYWIRTWTSVAGGSVWYNTDYACQSSFGDKYEEGTGLSDKTMGGTIPASTHRQLLPIFLMGDCAPSHHAIAVIGDSISNGTGGYFRALTGGALGAGYGGGIGYMAGYLDGVCDYAQFGYSGQTATQSTTHFARRAATIAGGNFSKVWCEYGINDLTGAGVGARTSAQLAADLATVWGIIATAFAGAGHAAPLFYQSTITPKTTLSDGGPTSDTDQTINTNLADGRRNTFNTLVMANGIAGQYGHVDAATAVQNIAVPNADWWAAGYSDDALHPNTIGSPPIVAACQAQGALTN